MLVSSPAFLTLWSGALSALVSLVVTALTIGFTYRRARKDRELSLRRDIYLAALEAASAGMTALEQCTNPDSSYTVAIRPYQERAASITKIYLVASLESVALFTNFRDELEAALTRALLRKLGQQKQDQRDGKNLGSGASTGQQFDPRARRLVDALQEWNQEAERLGRLFTSVLASFRKELDLRIEEIELHRVFDAARRNRSDFVKRASNLLSPPPEKGDSSAA